MLANSCVRNRPPPFKRLHVTPAAYRLATLDPADVLVQYSRSIPGEKYSTYVVVLLIELSKLLMCVTMMGYVFIRYSYAIHTHMPLRHTAMSIPGSSHLMPGNSRVGAP